MKNHKVTFWFIWTILAMALIFIQGLLPASKSNAESTAVWTTLLVYFPKLTHAMLRKIAHFGEFFLLGFGMQGTLYYGKKYNMSKPMLLCLLVAIADETIQMHVAGRSSEIMDIWIDFAGAVVGVFFLWCIFKLQKK
jgi:VanZ family protein